MSSLGGCPGCRASRDAAIVDVGDVLHVRDAMAQGDEMTTQHVEREERARVTQMRLRRRREATDIDANVVLAERRRRIWVTRARSSRSTCCVENVRNERA